MFGRVLDFIFIFPRKIRKTYRAFLQSIEGYCCTLYAFIRIYSRAPPRRLATQRSAFPASSPRAVHLQPDKTRSKSKRIGGKNAHTVAVKLPRRSFDTSRPYGHFPGQSVHMITTNHRPLYLPNGGEKYTFRGIVCFPARGPRCRNITDPSIITR